MVKKDPTDPTASKVKREPSNPPPLPAPQISTKQEQAIKPEVKHEQPKMKSMLDFEMFLNRQIGVNPTQVKQQTFSFAPSIQASDTKLFKFAEAVK